MRCFGLPAVAVAMACLAAGAAGAQKASPCGPVSAHTLANDGHARVYAQHSGVFGCSPGAAAVRLGGSTTSCLGSDRIGPVALAGTTAAYADERCGIDTGSTEIVARRLSDGHQLASAAAGTQRSPESYTTVAAIVVRSGGAIAWIATSSSLATMGSVTEVWRLDRGRLRRLDASISGSIATRSLRLHGRTLTWHAAGRTRSATLA